MCCIETYLKFKIPHEGERRELIDLIFWVVGINFINSLHRKQWLHNLY